MIPEVKVNHWKWCEVQGNSPHERWEWCEVNEEVDVYTALWLDKVQNIDFDDYIEKVSLTDFMKQKLNEFNSDTYLECFYKGNTTEIGWTYVYGYLIGLAENHKFENIDEKLYTNEND